MCQSRIIIARSINWEFQHSDVIRRINNGKANPTRTCCDAELNIPIPNVYKNKDIVPTFNTY